MIPDLSNITGVQVAVFLFFMVLPFAMYQFFKLGFGHGAVYMAQRLHEGNYLTRAGVEELGLDEETPDEA
jgi:hypothetical protein